MHNNAITGMGVSGAGYPDVAALADLLRNERVVIHNHQRFPECNFPAAQVGAVFSEMDIVSDLKHSAICKEQLCNAQKLVKRHSLVYQTALSAMLQAWNQANLFSQPYGPDEVAIIVAGQNLHLYEQYQAVKKFIKEPAYISPAYAQQFIDSSLMSFLSKFFGIKGCGFTCSAATASGNLGIIQAINLLDERIKCCIVVGAMANLSPVELQGFYNSGALGGDAYLDNPQQACRPFDADHNGFIYGQGCGALVIETTTSAQKRQQPVLAHIIGSAMTLDAQATTQPNLSGEVRVMKKVLAHAYYPRIDYINAHGTGTPLGDDTEARAIEEVFPDKPYINATKALIGHTLWSAAVIECIACIVQLKGGFLHGNINLDKPINPHLNFVGKQGITLPIECALSVSFGFGGINTAIIIKAGEGEFHEL